MKTLNLIIALMLSIGAASAQSGFRAFIESFPQIQFWDKLPVDIRDLKASNKELNIDTVNRYCFPANYFNKFDKRPGYDRIKQLYAPKQIGLNGKSYFNGDESEFSNQSIVNDTLIIKYHIYPIGRLQVNDSVCIIFLLYKGPIEDDLLKSGLYYEAYTFNTMVNRILSSITLFKDSKICFSFIDSNHQFIIYEYEEIIVNADDNTEEMIFRRTYKLRDDGYFQMKSNESLCTSKKIACFSVIDPDGFTNIRAQPTTQSPILYTIKAGLGGLLEITDNPNWYRVIYSNDGIDYPGKDAHTQGWIHKSRVCFDTDRYGWKKGDEQVCK